MNETNVRNEILDSIDRVESLTMESSLDVLFSLGAAYEKSAMIMEYVSDPNDLNMFSIFQEADEKPGENANGTESTGTTVTANDNAPAANAEAQKKGIFSKIWGFIKTLFSNIGRFIKNCWNGVAIPTAEAVSDTTKEVVNKIAGKDESWIKTHWKEFIKTNIGIDLAEMLVPIGALMTGFGAAEGSLLTALLGVGLTAAGAKVYMALSTDSAKTNLKIWGFNILIKTIIGIFSGFKTKKKISELMKQWKDATSDEKVNPIIDENNIDVEYEELFRAAGEIKSACENADINPEDVDAYVKAGENVDVTQANLSEEKKFAGFLAKIGKVFLAVQNFFKEIAVKAKEFFNRLRGVDNAIKEAESTAAPAETPAATEGETGEANAEGTEGAEGSETTTETPAAAEGEPKVESAETAVSEGDEVTQESAELTDAEIEINNHWYR